ncbi:MAG: NAD(P)-dependent alcohol dehydrogenase [Acidobacteria bacterium]|nr:NAD(P)-dependent alcohol dehydrogenase [Acidobacteriota bacterium]
MKAVVRDRYGGPEVLELKEVPAPTAGPGEVLVRVRAVSINDWDWGLLVGDFVNRMLAGPLRPKFAILGSDIAGVVEAVGSGVEDLEIGDEVFGDLSGRWGGFAELVAAPRAALALKPAVMSFPQAAALPQAGALAVQGLIDRGEIRPGQSILINGAGGGVGTLGVQIARTFGVETTGVDSAAKLDVMRAAGYRHVIDYETEDFTRNGRRYDLILDVKTNRSPFAYLRALQPGGTYVTVGGSILRLLQLLVLSPVIRLASGKRLRIVSLELNKGLDYLSELFEAGKLRPVLDDLRPLSELPAAMKVFGAGRHKGKVVILLP